MKCPYCDHLDNKVIDSRLNKDCTITRRRRSCLACDQRFTTYERLEVMMPVLVKKDKRYCKNSKILKCLIDSYLYSNAYPRV